MEERDKRKLFVKTAVFLVIETPLSKFPIP